MSFEHPESIARYVNNLKRLQERLCARAIVKSVAREKIMVNLKVLRDRFGVPDTIGEELIFVADGVTNPHTVKETSGRMLAYVIGALETWIACANCKFLLSDSWPNSTMHQIVCSNAEKIEKRIFLPQDKNICPRWEPKK